MGLDRVMAYDSIPTVEALEHEVRDLDRRLQAAQALLAAARAYQQVSAPSAPSLPPKAAELSPAPRKFVLRLKGPMHQTETTASKLMESLNRPVSTGEIVKEQLSQGHPLPENASNVVSARMSNSSKFSGRRGEGWWFSDRPWPGDESELFNENGSAT
jgi:hypothetical protein